MKDKERANFCGYFNPRPNAHVAADTAEADAARGQLDALFGLEGTDDRAGRSDDDDARRKLDELFGLGDDERK